MSDNGNLMVPEPPTVIAYNETVYFFPTTQENIIEIPVVPLYESDLPRPAMQDNVTVGYFITIPEVELNATNEVA